MVRVLKKRGKKQTKRNSQQPKVIDRFKIRKIGTNRSKKRKRRTVRRDRKSRIIQRWTADFLPVTDAFSRLVEVKKKKEEEIIRQKGNRDTRPTTRVS